MFFGMLISAFIVFFFKQGSLTQIEWKETYGSALFFASATLSNYSLSFVDFPFMALAKSAKIIPVALIGTLLGVYKLKFFQYITTLAITGGLILFNFKKIMNIKNEPLVGQALVLGSLIIDGLGMAFQEKFMKKSSAAKKPSPYVSMFVNSLTQFLLAAAFYAVNSTLFGDSSWKRIIADKELLSATVQMAVSAAFAQIFIFLTVAMFSGYIVTITTTTRKCLSVLISIWFFKHEVSSI